MTEVSATPLARYKDLCVDAVDIDRAGRFWAAALGLSLHSEEGSVWLSGSEKVQTIWINEVPEPKTVKNRAHLDVYAGAPADLEALGARIVRPADDDQRWTVLRDPDGQEFCAFVRREPPDYRLYELVIDSAAPEQIASWWAEAFGTSVEAGEGYWYLQIPGAPFAAMTFVTVPEPKTVKNRVHWDVVGDPARLVGAGARVLRPKGGDTRWHVLADPDGNEFCAFDAG